MGWFRDMRLRWKLLSGFALVLLLMCGLSTYVFISSRQAAEAAHWVEHTYQVVSLADDGLAGLVNMETGYRGFLVTGKDEFLEPYTAGKTLYQEKLKALQRETSDN